VWNEEGIGKEGERRGEVSEWAMCGGSSFESERMKMVLLCFYFQMSAVVQTMSTWFATVEYS
jgi:hypothetical protein